LNQAQDDELGCQIAPAIQVAGGSEIGGLTWLRRNRNWQARNLTFVRTTLSVADQAFDEEKFGNRDRVSGAAGLIGGVIVR